ncbi:MAG: flagellar biosynthesis regulator FlaF [Pseudomonadota bacterium]
MNNYASANTAYGNARSSASSPRQIEYQAFAQVTKEIRLSADTVTTDFPRHAEALHRNLRLWTILSSSVIEGSNGLPDTLRARLYHLGEFTRNHTRKVLRGEGDAEALIDINTAIMRGLRQSAPAAQNQEGAA